MNKILILIFFIIFQSCSKPKSVLICGDHVCINKKEAKQYFEENLSLEVKIIDNKKKENFNLVELNLKENSEKRKISVVKKEKTKKKLKSLSRKEIREIKDNIKKKKKKDRVVKTNLKNKERKFKASTIQNKIKKSKKNVNKDINITDVCTIVDKCSIDEISKYLIKIGKKKKFSRYNYQRIIFYMKKLNIAIIGLGNIGSYLFKYLKRKQKYIIEEK